MTTTTRALSIVHKFFPDVTTVKDATKDIQIEVTKRDTSSAKVKNHKECALAVACRRLQDVDGVIISLSRAYLIKDHVAIRYELEDAVAREITAFDRGAAFEAGEYTLLKIAKGHIQKPRGGDGGKHTGTRPRPRHMTAGVRAALTS